MGQSRMFEENLEVVKQPLERDVLCGKNKECLEHPGSKAFRDIIEQFVTRYQQADSKVRYRLFATLPAWPDGANSVLWNHFYSIWKWKLPKKYINTWASSRLDFSNTTPILECGKSLQVRQCETRSVTRKCNKTETVKIEPQHIIFSLCHLPSCEQTTLCKPQKEE